MIDFGNPVNAPKNIFPQRPLDHSNNVFFFSWDFFVVLVKITLWHFVLKLLLQQRQPSSQLIF